MVLLSQRKILGVSAIIAIGHTFGCRPQSPDAARLPAAASFAPAGTAWFRDVTSESGISFRHRSGGVGNFELIEIMSGGIALFDFDNDGDLDLYCINSASDLPPTASASEARNRLYRQEDDGRFVDVTDASGLGDRGYGMGVAVADIDNDGDVDVYVTNYGPDRLFRNNGDGTFDDITELWNVDVPGWSCSVSFLDYDRDGYLDIYVTQYVDYVAGRRCKDHAGRPDYCGPKAFPPVHDVLLRNTGGAATPGFADVSRSAGLTTVRGASLGVVCRDFTQDGWPDIYVASDAYANQLWVNQQNGTFEDESLFRGAAYNLHGQAEAGMGVLAADINADGIEDLFVTHLNKESNTFYRGRSDAGTFVDASGLTGLASDSMTYTGFGTVAFDIELDGDLDIAVANGRVVRAEPKTDSALSFPWNMFCEPNLAYLNDGAGTFTTIGLAGASFTSPAEISRGLAAGDFDNDGDVDIVVNSIEGHARLYRNDAPRSGSWLGVRAWDPRLMRDAIGARVTVASGGTTSTRVVDTGSSYLSAHDPRVHFGLGLSKSIESVQIIWPDGLVERFSGISPDRYVTLERAAGDPQP